MVKSIRRFRAKAVYRLKVFLTTGRSSDLLLSHLKIGWPYLKNTPGTIGRSWFNEIYRITEMYFEKYVFSNSRKYMRKITFRKNDQK